MTFLQPMLLAALPLIALPIVIHLLNRLRYRTRDWAATRYLQRANRSSTRYARLRQFLVLLFRALAVAALILMLARPLTGGWLGASLAGRPDTIYVVLDTSPSMGIEREAGGPELAARAAGLLRDALRDMRGASIVLLDPATAEPRPVVNPEELDDMARTLKHDGATPFASLFLAVARHLETRPAGRAEVWVASDLARADWAPDDPLWARATTALLALPDDVRVRVLDVPRPASPNAAVHVRSSRMLPGREPQVEVAIAVLRGSGADEATIPITLSTGEQTVRIDVRLSTGLTRLTRRLAVPASRGWGSVRLPDDANARDNVAWFVYGAGTEGLCIIRTADDTLGSLLAHAAAPYGAESGPPTERQPIGTATTTNLTRAAAVLWQGPPPDETEAERLQQFVRSGGALVWLPPGAAHRAPEHGRTPGWSEPRDAPADAPWTVQDWSEHDGPLAASSQGQSLPVQSIEAVRIQVPQLVGARTIARLDGGAPLLIARSEGAGNHFALATLPRPAWSTLGDGAVLVPMLQRILADGAQRLAGASLAACGVWFPERKGAWTVLDGGPKIMGHAGVFSTPERIVAVNVPRRELDPDRVTQDDVRACLGELPVHFREERASGGDDALQGEIWRAVLLVMLTFLLMESWLTRPSARALEGTA